MSYRNVKAMSEKINWKKFINFCSNFHFIYVHVIEMITIHGYSANIVKLDYLLLVDILQSLIISKVCMSINYKIMIKFLLLVDIYQILSIDVSIIF